MHGKLDVHRTFLLNGDSVENAQAIAAHESPRTTKLYDSTTDEISLDEIERIVIYGEVEKRVAYNVGPDSVRVATPYQIHAQKLRQR